MQIVFRELFKLRTGDKQLSKGVASLAVIVVKGARAGVTTD